MVKSHTVAKIHTLWTKTVAKILALGQFLLWWVRPIPTLVPTPTIPTPNFGPIPFLGGEILALGFFEERDGC